VLFYLKDSDLAIDFMEQLCSGIDITHKQISLLRNKLINDKLSTKKLPIANKIAFMIKAWNYIRKNQQVSILNFQPDREEFPTLI
jgi:hypothetical protein